MKYVLDKVKIFLFWFGEEGKVVDHCSTADMTIWSELCRLLKSTAISTYCFITSNMALTSVLNYTFNYM